jgi:hypothetical protein
MRRVQKILDRLFVTPGDVLIDLIARGTESRSAQQVRHYSDIFMFSRNGSHDFSTPVTFNSAGSTRTLFYLRPTYTHLVRAKG